MPETTNKSSCRTAFECRMSVYPICDDFVRVILVSLDKINKSKIWADTDHLGTVYRGKMPHVLDCVRALFLYVCRESEPVAGKFSFTKGYVNAHEADNFFLDADDELCNAPFLETLGIKGDVIVYSSISFYAPGETDYEKHIRVITEIAEKRKLNHWPSGHVTMLEGSTDELFAFFDEVLVYAHETLPKYALEAAITYKSPSKVKRGAK